ncbi:MULTISPECIES: UTP--glucose-1-phosphate uridylyltransferase GalU [Neobacillus]|jgi:UTP--glucose-1-phosphate uridylyltransferase|uniref:UTP--glucose-1-phosphate uridylyltransferase n=1 Tax=Neobacillus sedimentimangrovi TaxID=2699460 RepID=A0ABS8QFX5_9BACI|nr:UTP--glucose-1-phosphate uridylyltransferase GalU [Neobacillus sedimentimangrovi]AIM16238.1 UTP--glucose-1-phosphate uridylyltransferase [Bacillus sp. X1(2014)]MCD4838002.1 UTP--glucose-1-phosphate uridylyltransferase GalU [Neobacillus sedimentimangrovi]
MAIKKAVIPAAGLGTRFLPATKAQPKEMLPIVDKPTIQYIVEEAVASGIEDIIIVTGRNKRAIEDHFDFSIELELELQEKNKHELLNMVKQISTMVNIHYIRQKKPLGLGHAVHCARRFIGNEPFAVLLGDDIVKNDKPCLKQMLEVYEKYNCSVIGTKIMPDEELHKYGVIAPGSKVADNIVEVKDMIEKPKENAPSNFAVMGRYVLKPEIFSYLEEVGTGYGGEIQLTDALRKMASNEKVLAYAFEGIRYDVGDKFGFLQATIEFALQREDLKDLLTDYLKELHRKNYLPYS